MTGVQGTRSAEDDASGGDRREPEAILRIDTDVFTTLTEARVDSDETEPSIVRWFENWQR